MSSSHANTNACTSGSPVLVAPDSFKGTLSAIQVADAIGQGLRDAGVPVDLCPAADGGEGTVDALAIAFGASSVSATVSDPLGRPISASFALHDGLAIIETAAASGLERLAAGERNAVAASSAGTGELIVAALRAGARTIYLGAGGSATTDGGAGAVQAIEQAGGLRGARLVMLCDVRTPFEDAAKIFARQKGASQTEVRQLTARLNLLAQRYPRDPRGVSMSGAAGGLAGGLWAAMGAELVPGARFVLDAIGFDRRACRAQMVITGEGKLDSQSLTGKLVSEITSRAGGLGIPSFAIVGSRALDLDRVHAMGLTTVLEASTLDEIKASARRLADTFANGSQPHASFG